MSEVEESIEQAVEAAQEHKSRLNDAVAVMVAVLATFMALCNVKDGNVVQAMAQAQAHAIDAWSFYQAKSTKQNLAESMLDQLRVERELAGAKTDAERALIDRELAAYDAKVKRYDAEKAEIKAKAEGFEQEYDALNVHDDQFDMAESGISIAIALLGVTALTQRRWLFAVAVAFGGAGFFLGLAGFLGWSVHPDFVARLLG